MFHSIGFIGTGTMGSALARAAYKGAPEGSTIYLANRRRAKAEALAEQLPGSIVLTNEEVCQTCDLIFLAVKPQRMDAVLGSLSRVLAQRKDRFVLASMAAGLSMETIQKMARHPYPVIRLMPNVPVSVGAGVIQYCGTDTTREELEDFKTLLAPAGMVDEINENMCDAALSLSGCGPAFCALLIEALADSAVYCGLPREKALRYTVQMVEGAAKLMLDSGIHPGVMKDDVCSPGGTTIRGIRVLEEQGFRAAAMNAVIAAYERTVELGKTKDD